MDVAYSSLGQTIVLYATSLVLIGAKVNFMRRKPSVLVALEEIPEIHVISDRYTKLFLLLNIFHNLAV